ncbi:hypothetical protein PHYSODRAFT_322325 [Phytophthora sojae]|uniref:Uncharacterized protein n=1 Tax=Phytophthora sojae (strain P6497) TaxID=1094619 RepID=G4YG77_PHYSP|nr:hypothetical protein PHYSODRAFT_322325 [Phytophthora sojae]EGZ28689.1 hypothetical protein PHYSODRAFT_322325 [Phytophthora sojae]|eukprot:XP_009515964.1 hypothetical protein PHYSODRAFT_322325 [Phytophthora sojae]
MAPSSPSAPARPGSSEDGDAGLARGYSKRGDGFSVQETEGLLQQVRERWQEGWDVIAELHNAQFPGHKRTASSLKRKFAKLYRTKIDANTKEKHARAAALAKKVREEMRGQRRAGLVSARALSEDLVAETDVQEVHEDLTEVEMITSQPGAQSHALPEPAVTASEHELRQTLTQSVAMAQETPMREDAWQSAINRLPVSGDRLRTLRAQIENGETTASQDMMQTVLLVLLESQHQHNLEREQEREERRQEKLRCQEEMREQRRRCEQDRAEDRRRNEQFMQVMTTLVAQIAAGQQHRTGLN